MTQYVVRYAYVVLRYFVKKNKKNEDPRRFVNHTVLYLYQSIRV